MKRIAIIIFFAGLLSYVGSAQESPRKQVEAYFQALLEKRLDLALEAFGSKPNFSPSQKAVLREYKIVDPTKVGRCESNLKALGKALAKRNKFQTGYPASLDALGKEFSNPGSRCPESPESPYVYERRDQYYYLLSCPHGHGRTPGFPKYSPIDGLLPNPKLTLLTYYKILGEKEEDGLTKVQVIGASPRGPFERDFVFTPSGGFVSGDFSKEIKRLMKAMTKTTLPRATKLDPASLLLGVAVFDDQELIRAAHCRLLQEKFYYKILGVQTRLGEKSFLDVAKHIDDIPECPTSKKSLLLKKDKDGKNWIYCPGASHAPAGLDRNEPSRKF